MEQIEFFPLAYGVPCMDGRRHYECDCLRDPRGLQWKDARQAYGSH